MTATGKRIVNGTGQCKYLPSLFGGQPRGDAHVRMPGVHYAETALGALGVYRWVWHPALFDTALYVLLLYVVSHVASLLQTH